MSLPLPAQETSPAPLTDAQLHTLFVHPPDDARILMRWWWFGPAATKPEITRELETMKAAGIGGAEIANLYPLALDDAGFHNTPFLSPEHLDALRFAGEEARRLGLRLDVTLGSGWPFGGPHIPVSEAAGKLRVETTDLPAGATEAKAPFVDAGESFLSAFLLPDTASIRRIAGAAHAGRLHLQPHRHDGQAASRRRGRLRARSLRQCGDRRAPARRRRQVALGFWRPPSLRCLQ
jgi:hypothetical protein